MDYGEFVTQHAGVLSESGLSKYAQDLARLLNDPLLAVPAGRDYAVETAVKTRLSVFDRLCSVCVATGLEVPPLEDCFVDAFLPSAAQLERSQTSRDALAAQVREGCPEGEAGDDLRALARVLRMFHFDQFNGPREAQMIAAMNAELRKLGMPLLRPEYPGQVFVPGERTTGPTRRVLIVDDRVDDIVASWLALAGWPTLELSYHRYTGMRYELKGDELTARAAEIATTVLAQEPAIVLMDQGLGDVDGGAVVRAIQAQRTDMPVLVGNTGGGAEAMEKLGLTSNFEKGKKPSAIELALLSA